MRINVLSTFQINSLEKLRQRASCECGGESPHALPVPLGSMTEKQTSSAICTGKPMSPVHDVATFLLSLPVLLLCCAQVMAFGQKNKSWQGEGDQGMMLSCSGKG